ncbi:MULTISPECIES: ribokinase [Janthinobacterium]|uniref:Ribokinase n=1 Tax=Janthinobacterium lividum TaxID=29581 RepID=A0AAJ4MSR8_9BURK|nr:MULTISPECIES: ribokinase [Janthinobacterium]KAB0330268.1 ribokinase [Janthinobacterium lividum]KHA79442.1 ribokinase [Janthinobacterium lividum]MCC7700529.1 ribokinase [Janthinobacterium sp. EB271-G4-7A]QSX96478.1 ribokinase [Janthinobacterium lividum]UGQ36368.1 ribokinase [Janthinobacterium sp. PLB04]
MIVVIGSINMDLVLRVPRMPLPGETLTGGAFRTIPGGKGANQAVACARLSGKVAGAQQVAMVGCVGDDAFGTTLRAALVGDGIIDSHITTLPGVASGIASILVDDNGQNSIVIAGGANDLLSPAHIDAAQGLIEQADIVVLQLETPMATVVHAIKLARSLGKTVVLNPAPAASLPEGVLELVDYLIPNEIEAAMLAGVSPEGADAKALAAALQKLGSDNVIITLGSKGVHAALYGGDFTFPAEVVKAVDTTAAGDTFIGGFVAGLASGMDEAEAIQQGQRAAAWSVTKPGAQTSIPHLHELF